MSNRFFNYLTRFIAGTKVRAEQANTRFDELETAFTNVAGELDALNAASSVVAAAVTLASATTTLISTAGSINVTMTGVATITAFDTMADGTIRNITAAGAFTLTHNATSLILPGGANIVAAAGDTFVLKSLGSGNWRVTDYMRASGKALKAVADDVTATPFGNLAGTTVQSQINELDVEKAKAAGDAAQDFSAKDLTAAGAVTVGTVLNEHKGADIASASTIDLDAATGNLVDVTGTTTITAITLAAGRERTVRFTGALILTHGSSLVLPGGASITTSDGTFAIFRGDSGGVVRCVYCSKYAPAGTLLDVQVFTGNGTWTKPAGVGSTGFSVIELQGPGGNGATSSGAASQCSLGSGGGGGAFIRAKVAAANLGATEAIVVGTSSGTGSSMTVTTGSGTITAGSGNNGTSLATGSSITSQVGGGGGGISISAGITSYVTTIFGRNGSNGGPAYRLSGSSGLSGAGGNSFLGSGGQYMPVGGSLDVQPGFAGATYGGGGGGGISSGSNATGTGGSGAAGIAIVYTYA